MTVPELPQRTGLSRTRCCVISEIVRESCATKWQRACRKQGIMNRPRTLVAATLLFVLLAATGRPMAQEDARKLFEAGKFQAAVEQSASDASPAAQYLRGLAQLKLNQPDAAK